MKVSLMSNNSDTSKIHFVVVFVDIAVDLGVLVEHRNSPFVFYRSETSLIAQLQSDATDFLHCARLWPFSGLSVAGTNCSQFSVV